MRDTIELLSFLDNANVKAFLAVIRAGEGTADEAGYRRHFGGRLFDSFADHPRVAITAGLGQHQYTSTAAGAYQFLERTWDSLVKRYGFADFAPRTQDIAAIALIDGRKALDDVLAGRFQQAVRKTNREWASLPESPYGQPTRTMAQAEEVYREHGGVLRPQGMPAPVESREILPQADIYPVSPSTDKPEPPMTPILAALLPSFIEAIPRLGKLFGSGSAVAERNVKAAELAVGIVQEAVGARNAQEAAEMVRTDPAAAQAAIQAIESRWYELTESGGGGIEGARKFDVTAMGDKGLLASPSFWVAIALLPLVYAIVGTVVGLWGAAFSDDVRSAIANGVISMVIGALVGYYFGQTTSRNRTPAP